MSMNLERSWLPDEIWQLIGGYLPTTDLRRLVQVSRKIHKTLMYKPIWVNALKREGKYLASYTYLDLSTILLCQRENKTLPFYRSGCYK